MQLSVCFSNDSSQFFVRCFSLAFFSLLGGDAIAIDEDEKPDVKSESCGNEGKTVIILVTAI